VLCTRGEFRVDTFGATAGHLQSHGMSDSAEGMSQQQSAPRGHTMYGGGIASLFDDGLFDLQTEPQPEPLTGGAVAGRKPRELTDDSAGSCREAGRYGPNSGALLALLARAAARARHGAARSGA
jgi:hypothetical protein